MRYTKLTAILAAIIFAAGCCQQPKCEIANLPAKWQFSTENTPLYEGTWTGEHHYLGAMNGATSKITAVSADATKQDKFEYRIRGNKAEVNNLENGDYILFCTPVSHIEAGSHIEIDAVVMSSPHSPKYFIAEILDGKEWKSSEDDLRTAEEDPPQRGQLCATRRNPDLQHLHSEPYGERGERQMAHGELSAYS